MSAALDGLRLKSRTSIAEHWRRCHEGGLPHSPENEKQVLAAFEEFFSKLKSLSHATREAEGLAAIKRLYSSLDEINEAYDDGVLETDERELLVPIIWEAAKLAGVNQEQPGEEHRNF